MNESDKKFWLLSGLFLMLICAASIIMLDKISARQWVGIILVFVIGLGLVVAGSPDTRKKD